MERNGFLINKKIHQYILPGVLMTVAMQLGNVVDGMIVGNILGPDAMAAIEISMPVLLLLQMPAMMLAMGGKSRRAVGEKEYPGGGRCVQRFGRGGAGPVAVLCGVYPVPSRHSCNGPCGQ